MICYTNNSMLKENIVFVYFFIIINILTSKLVTLLEVLTAPSKLVYQTSSL